ncbi:hypothetical protein DESA109040_00115 [Deinococcus saxicola]
MNRFPDARNLLTVTLGLLALMLMSGVLARVL